MAFNMLKLSILALLATTSVVLRLECSIDCINGSVGHGLHEPENIWLPASTTIPLICQRQKGRIKVKQNIFHSFSLSAFLLKNKKLQKKLIKRI